MGRDLVDNCTYVTDRLSVRPWHDVSGPDVGSLASEVASILTPITTLALPVSWHGDFSEDRAREWIAERDAESPTLLVTERETGSVVGLLILADEPHDDGGSDLRIGYVIGELYWGHGYGSEMVQGLVSWARSQRDVRTVSGAVDVTNVGSIRVLEKSGFQMVGLSQDTMVSYQITVDNEWDHYADQWDEDPTVCAYAEAAFGSLTKVVGALGLELTGAKVLDFGCGTGLLTERLLDAGAIVDAVDTSHAMLNVVKSKIVEHQWTTVTPASELAENHGDYDLVVCSSVCGFLDDYSASVKDLVSRLTTGGCFVQWDWERVDAESHGLSRHEIAAGLEQAGLGRIHVESAFTVEIDGESASPLVGYGQL